MYEDILNYLYGGGYPEFDDLLYDDFDEYGDNMIDPFYFGLSSYPDAKTLMKEARAMAASQEVILKLAEELDKRPQLAELLRLVLGVY